MSLRRRVVVLVSVALVAAGCSDPQTPTAGAPEEAPSPRARPPEDGGAKRYGKRSRDRSAREGKKRERKERAPGSDGERSGPSREDAGGRDRVALFPAAGDYVYDQNGTERFCQSGACDERDLPDTQRVRTSVKRRSDAAAVIVSEAQVSQSRFSRTTIRFARDAAFITQVHARFSYGAFEFQNTYHPRPPVESLRFPLRVGMEWSGSWKDDVSGSYEIRVVRRVRMRVGRSEVDAFQLGSRTQFRGDFEGESIITLWVDPRTKAVVRTDGRMRLRSAFGTYETEFVTALRSAPVYK
ncbi:MAG: hypothetical protein ACRDJJ_02690 [Actinomycetota bacterium]